MMSALAATVRTIDNTLTLRMLTDVCVVNLDA